MKYLVSWQAVVIVLIAFIAVLCVPIIGNASLKQDTILSNTITVNSVNSKWLDGQERKLDEISIPEHVVPGETLDINGGLKLKNTGMDSYARFKTEFKLNDVDTILLELDIDENWKQGSDGWYYYINSTNREKIALGEVVKVIDTIKILDTFTNANSDDVISMEFSAEVLDSGTIDWVSMWGENPPAEWFEASGNTI